MATTPKEFNKPNRTRRAVYVFGGTLVFAAMAFYVTLFGSGDIAEAFVKGCMGVIQWIVLLYLSTTTIDRSEILSNLGKNMGMPTSKSKPPSPASEPYEEDPDAKG